MFPHNRPRKIFSKKSSPRRLPVSLVIIGLLALLLFLVPTYTPKEIDVPPSFTPKPTLPPTTSPVPPPTYTPAPLPTGLHGGRVIFTCTRGDYNHLCMINQDGSGLLRLTDAFANDYYPSFSSQGGAIAFASNRHAASPDGAADFDIYKIRPDGTELVRLTEDPGIADEPAYSHDGKRLYLTSTRDRKNPYEIELYVMPATGGDQRRVTRDERPQNRSPSTGLTQ